MKPGKHMSFLSSQTYITTNRLILKCITPAIIRELFKTKTQEEIVGYFDLDEEGFTRMKNMHEKGMETHRLSLCYFLLIDKNTDKIIGECGFHTLNISHQRAELFYSLKNDSDKRKGFMKEALTEVLAYGYNTIGLHRVEALTAQWNTASIALLNHFGFTKEGTMREDYIVNGVNENSECYSLLKWEWEKNNVPI